MEEKTLRDKKGRFVKGFSKKLSDKHKENIKKGVNKVKYKFNLMIVCKSCHNKIHEKWKNLLSKPLDVAGGDFLCQMII